MTAAVNQDFKTFAGDDVAPIFTVLDGNGDVIDISSVTQIEWYFQLTVEAGPIATLRKTSGEITFVTDGTDGRFTVAIPASITAVENGWYQHLARITDAFGKKTTIEVGRMQIGVKPTWTYNAAAVATTPLFQVRRWLGDVIANDQQMLDSEILYALSVRPNPISAAADCARQLGAQYSRKADTESPGAIKTRYGDQGKKYLALAGELDSLARGRGVGIMPYAGGISVQDKQNVISNTDRVVPSFNIGMDDNRLIPLTPGGTQQLSNPNGGGNGNG